MHLPCICCFLYDFSCFNSLRYFCVQKQITDTTNIFGFSCVKLTSIYLLLLIGSIFKLVKQIPHSCHDGHNGHLVWEEKKDIMSK